MKTQEPSIEHKIRKFIIGVSGCSYRKLEGRNWKKGLVIKQRQRNLVRWISPLGVRGSEGLRKVGSFRKKLEEKVAGCRLGSGKHEAGSGKLQ